MEALLLFILVWSAISWHLQNKPKRHRPKPPPTQSTHTVRRGVFFYKGSNVPHIDLPPQPTFGNPYMSASDKLAHMDSPYWKQLKLDRLALSDNKCELCKSTYFLQLHHTSYIRLGCEKLSDVVILCGGPDGCHQLQHDHYGYSRETIYYPLVKPKLGE